MGKVNFHRSSNFEVTQITFFLLQPVISVIESDVLSVKKVVFMQFLQLLRKLEKSGEGFLSPERVHVDD